MKLLAVSEHYYPRVGGTVNYVHETLCALAAIGVDAELLVPGPEANGSKQNDRPYRVTWIDAGYPMVGDPSREQRYDFCHKVDALVKQKLNGPTRPDRLHVLFGLFVMEVLDTDHFRDNGLPSIATVHNVPPMECRLITQDATWKTRLREELRLRAVSWKNRRRLKRHRYDAYVVPSNQVKGFLGRTINADIQVIGHGLTTDLQDQMSPPERRSPTRKTLRLLTVGGYAPHKRQHIIPKTAQMLRDAGVDFVWDVVGPSGRISGFFDSIKGTVEEMGIGDLVELNDAVTFDDLGQLYDRANIYVQPSIEEGFCLTALDAAAVGLPVIASPAGALPDIVEASGGILVESEPQLLADAIVEFIRAEGWADPHEVSVRVRSKFSWGAAATSLVALYEGIDA